MRPLIIFVLLAALLSSATITAQPDTSSISAQTGPYKTAQATTAQFVDSIGINTHLSFLDTPYGNTAFIASKLASLGIHHIRDGVNLSAQGVFTPQAQAWVRLHHQGVRVLAMVDPRYAVKTITPDSMRMLTSAGDAAVEGVEGPNELDVSGIPDWPSVDRAYQKSLWDSRAALGLTSTQLPLVGPSMAFASNGEKLGNITQYSDFGNLHPYPGGQQPSVIFPHPGPVQDFFSKSFAQAEVMYDKQPLFITETGWHTCFTEQKKLPATPPQVIAAYVPRLYLENFNQGIRRTYLYELIAWKADPSGTNHEFHWGLLENDGTEKPAFATLKNLIAIAASTGAVPVNKGTSTISNVFTPQYALHSPSTAVHSTALRAADGSLLLFLWQELPGFNIPAQQTTNMSPVTVQVSSSFSARADFYDVEESSRPTRMLPAHRSFSLQVPNHVVAIRLTVQ